MTPTCAQHAYELAEGWRAQADCAACRRALIRDVAFSSAYRGLPLDRLAAVLIGLVAGGVAVSTFRGRTAAAAAVVLAIACLYALFSRRQSRSPHGWRRAFRRVLPRGATAAAAAPPIATRRRPHTTTRT